MFAYPLKTIDGNVLLWKLLLYAGCRAIDRVAVTKERMLSLVGMRMDYKLLRTRPV